mgnify:CR=1 FL=1
MDSSYDTPRKDNRSNWEFSYAASAVCAGARKKLDFVKSRIEFWTNKKEETIAKIRSDGMDFNESLSDMSSNSYSNRNDGVKIKDEFAEDLRECNARLKIHKERSEAYSGWIQVLEAQAEAPINLKYDDWLYFFGLPTADKAE